MAIIFSDGPLTVTPATTFLKPKGNETDGLGRVGASLGAAVATLIPVALHNIPGSGGEVFLVTEATDMGVLFTQGQLQNWTELKKAIQSGLLAMTVTGTIPVNTPR